MSLWIFENEKHKIKILWIIYANLEIAVHISNPSIFSILELSPPKILFTRYEIVFLKMKYKFLKIKTHCSCDFILIAKE